MYVNVSVSESRCGVCVCTCGSGMYMYVLADMIYTCMIHVYMQYMCLVCM